MLLYFSATGNNEYIAKFIAKETKDKALSMTEVSEEITLQSGEPLGIIVPTYFWGLPSYVEDFFENTDISTGGDNYIYLVATYGTTTGQIDYYLNKLLKKHGLRLSASFSIKTVDNYTVLFSVKDKSEIAQTLAEEKKQLISVLDKIKDKTVEFISKDKKSKFLCGGARVCYGSARKTKHFGVSAECIACGLCAQDCPEGAIEMIDGKPKWIKDKCTLCFRCLHRCPKFAIQYDNKTQNNGQYVHPQD